MIGLVSGAAVLSTSNDPRPGKSVTELIPLHVALDTQVLQHVFLLLGAETGNNNWDLNFQSFSLLVLENFDASPNFPKVRGNHCFINCISLRLIYTLKDPNLQYPKKLVASCQKKNSKISCRSSPFKNAIYFRSTISSSFKWIRRLSFKSIYLIINRLLCLRFLLCYDNFLCMIFCFCLMLWHLKSLPRCFQVEVYRLTNTKH